LAFVVADFAAADVQELRRRLDGLVGRRRVWLLVSHTASRTDTIESRLDDLGRDGRQLERYETVGAAAYLYDLGVRSP